MTSRSLARPSTSGRGEIGLARVAADPGALPRGVPGRWARRALWIAGWPARTLLLGAIRLYRATLAGVLGGQCRFDPSCSEYAEEAIARRGALVGSAFAAWRLIRCHPFARAGADPAPGPPPWAVYDTIIQRGPRSPR